MGFLSSISFLSGFSKTIDKSKLIKNFLVGERNLNSVSKQLSLYYG